MLIFPVQLTTSRIGNLTRLIHTLLYKYVMIIHTVSMEMSRLTRDGTTAEPFRETKFLGANGDREIIIFPVQLTTSRIGNLIRLIPTLTIFDDQTYI